MFTCAPSCPMPNGGPGKQPHGPGIAGSKSGYRASGDAASATGSGRFKSSTCDLPVGKRSVARVLFPPTGGGSFPRRAVGTRASRCASVCVWALRLPPTCSRRQRHSVKVQAHAPEVEPARYYWARFPSHWFHGMARHFEGCVVSHRPFEIS